VERASSPSLLVDTNSERSLAPQLSHNFGHEKFRRKPQTIHLMLVGFELPVDEKKARVSGTRQLLLDWSSALALFIITLVAFLILVAFCPHLLADAQAEMIVGIESNSHRQATSDEWIPHASMQTGAR
jgi:hypothetical protein